MEIDYDLLEIQQTILQGVVDAYIDGGADPDLAEALQGIEELISNLLKEHRGGPL